MSRHDDGGAVGQVARSFITGTFGALLMIEYRLSGRGRSR
jgi:hypothetical protein